MNSNRNERTKGIIKLIGVLGGIAGILLAFTQIFDWFEKKVNDKNNSKSKTTFDSVSTSPKDKSKPIYYIKSKSRNDLIQKLLTEARSYEPNNALPKYDSAYQLLPETKKNKKMYDSIKSIRNFHTQAKYFNSFFEKLKY